MRLYPKPVCARELSGGARTVVRMPPPKKTNLCWLGHGLPSTETRCCSFSSGTTSRESTLEWPWVKVRAETRRRARWSWYRCECPSLRGGCSDPPTCARARREWGRTLGRSTPGLARKHGLRRAATVCAHTRWESNTRRGQTQWLFRRRGGTARTFRNKSCHLRQSQRTDRRHCPPCSSRSTHREAPSYQTEHCGAQGAGDEGKSAKR